MKVLILTHSRTGGAGRAALYFSEIYKNIGWEVSIMTSEEKLANNTVIKKIILNYFISFLFLDYGELLIYLILRSMT